MIDPIQTVAGSWLMASGVYAVISLRNQSRNYRLAISTHQIVNSQRSVMLRTIARLWRRIADQNPDDEEARLEAEAAEEEAGLTDKPRR